MVGDRRQVCYFLNTGLAFGDNKTTTLSSQEKRQKERKRNQMCGAGISWKYSVFIAGFLNKASFSGPISSISGPSSSSTTSRVPGSLHSSPLAPRTKISPCPFSRFAVCFFQPGLHSPFWFLPEEFISSGLFLGLFTLHLCRSNIFFRRIS